MAVSLLVILLCMLGSAFFSGIETGMISIHRMRLRHFVRRGVPGAKTIQDLLNNPSSLLGTTLLGTNIFTVIISVVAADLALKHIGQWGDVVSTIVVTIMVLIFCEYMPKAWFHSKPIARCRQYIGLLKVFEVVLRPLSSTVIWMSNCLVSGELGAFSGHAPFITKDDLKAIARDGERHGVISSQERVMIHRVFELSDKQAMQIMIPLKDVTFVYEDMPIKEFYNIARTSGFTRFPVYSREKELFTGIINVFFTLSSGKSKEDGRTVADFMGAPLFVPDNMPVDEIFPRMRRSHIPMSLVKNKQAEVIGLITTEDILEEIVGELD